MNCDMGWTHAGCTHAMLQAIRHSGMVVPPAASCCAPGACMHALDAFPDVGARMPARPPPLLSRAPMHCMMQRWGQHRHTACLHTRQSEIQLAVGSPDASPTAASNCAHSRGRACTAHVAMQGAGAGSHLQEAVVDAEREAHGPYGQRSWFAPAQQEREDEGPAPYVHPSRRRAHVTHVLACGTRFCVRRKCMQLDATHTRPVDSSAGGCMHGWHPSNSMAHVARLPKGRLVCMPTRACKCSVSGKLRRAACALTRGSEERCPGLRRLRLTPL